MLSLEALLLDLVVELGYFFGEHVLQDLAALRPLLVFFDDRFLYLGNLSAISVVASIVALFSSLLLLG